MLVLPARGWHYSEVKRLNLIERHLLYEMLAIEADPMYQPDKT
jgi:hypothetical protein